MRIAAPYLIDVGVCLGLGAVAGVAGLFPPYCRPFATTDATIGYPFAVSETVPAWMLVLIVGPLPIFCLAALHRFRFKSQHLHMALLVWLQSVALAVAVTEVLKPVCGRLRPDFLDRLRIANHTAPEIADWKGLCQDTTFSTSHLMRQGRLSFPSGHSSMSFAGLTPVALMVAGQLGAFRPGEARMWKTLLCLVPVGVALFVAVSRTRDFRHNFDDVSVGAAIGLVAALVSYYMRYPGLSSPRCDVPFERTGQRGSDAAAPDLENVVEARTPTIES